ncbi:MAG: alpha/beta hydrolase [Bdellovibrionota bacterium]
MSFLKVGSTNLHYQLLENRTHTGNSAVVVFLHGLIMDNLSSWFFTLANPVAQNYDVLLYDMRGHGFSDRPRSGYAIEDHREDLRTLLDHIVPHKKVILVGNSFGGLLALNFAKTYADRVQGLVLVDAQVNNTEWREMMLNSFSLEGSERDQVITQNFQNWLGRSSKRKSSKLAMNAEDLLYKTTLLDDVRSATLMTDEDIRSIAAPTHAIYGGESDILTTAMALSRLMPQCNLRVVEDASHSVLWEKTDLVKEWIIQAIESLQELTAATVVLPYRKSPSFTRELQ